MSAFTQKEIRAAASAIANARGNRRGVPTVTNILEMLPKKLFDEVMEDAQAALDAAAGARTKVFEGSIDAIKEVSRLQVRERVLLGALKEISKGEGAFSRDPLEHATNTIGSMKSIALAAIVKAGAA